MGLEVPKLIFHSFIPFFRAFTIGVGVSTNFVSVNTIKLCFDTSTSIIVVDIVNMFVERRVDRRKDVTTIATITINTITITITIVTIVSSAGVMFVRSEIEWRKDDVSKRN